MVWVQDASRWMARPGSRRHVLIFPGLLQSRCLFFNLGLPEELWKAWSNESLFHTFRKVEVAGTQGGGADCTTTGFRQRKTGTHSLIVVSPTCWKKTNAASKEGERGKNLSSGRASFLFVWSGLVWFIFNVPRTLRIYLLQSESMQLIRSPRCHLILC